MADFIDFMQDALFDGGLRGRCLAQLMNPPGLLMRKMDQDTQWMHLTAKVYDKFFLIMNRCMDQQSLY